MKQFLLFLILAFPLNVAAETSAIKEAIAEKKGPVIEINAEGFSINGKAFTLPTTLAKLETVLGKHERVYSSCCRYFWDSTGVMVFENPKKGKGNGEIYSLTMSIDSDSTGVFGPKKTFTGSILVEGINITRNILPSNLNKELSKPFVKDNVTGNWDRVVKTNRVSLGLIEKPTPSWVNLGLPDEQAEKFIVK